MKFQIKSIILWPRNPSLKPRILPFISGSVNVITGASRTGKSAIIPIIDYCLGSEKCTIPVNTIRDACVWFGLLVDTENGQKLFARREPGVQKSTGDMFVLEGTQIEIPNIITAKNASTDSVKHTLDSLAGLTALDFDVEDTGSGFKGRPSFRDLGAFTFQPQNIIANPNVLFYKSDTYEHREKLRSMFPYILGAITPSLLAKQHELAELRRELRRKQNELQNIRQTSERWVADIKVHVSEAKEYGLINKPVLPTASTSELIEILSEMVKSHEWEANVSAATVTESISELMSLNKEERQVSVEVSTLRKRLSEMTNLRETVSEYKASLEIQRERLKVSQWMGKLHTDRNDCPLCGSQMEKATESLLSLEKALREIEVSSGDFSSIPVAFDREFERVRSELNLSCEKLQGIRIRIRELEKTSEDARKQQYDTLTVSRFIGNVEQALLTYESLGTDKELAGEVSELLAKVTALEKLISEGNVKERTRRAVMSVNLNAGKLLPYLDCEKPDLPISLLIDDLTVSMQNVDRQDYLWEIGSGSNWLAYHIAVSLGLHQYFLTMPLSSIPNFIVFDQPSQVYFPKKLAGKSEDDEDPQYRSDEDVLAVRKAFETFSKVVSESSKAIQIIVLDHAPESIWGRLPNVNLIEEWRGGIKLVPEEWLK